MENKQKSIRTEREAILFQEAAEVLESYQTGDTLLVLRLHEMEGEDGSFQTRVASGVMSEHIPMMKKTFEKIVRGSLDNVAQQDPFTAARLMANIMMQDQD